MSKNHTSWGEFWDTETNFFFFQNSTLTENLLYIDKKLDTAKVLATKHQGELVVRNLFNTFVVEEIVDEIGWK